MRARKRSHGPLKLQALYTFGELYKYFGSMSRFAVRRLFEKAGVRFRRSGRSLYIPASEIQYKLPDVWDSIILMEARWKKS